MGNGITSQVTLENFAKIEKYFEIAEKLKELNQGWYEDYPFHYILQIIDTSPIKVGEYRASLQSLSMALKNRESEQVKKLVESSALSASEDHHNDYASELIGKENTDQI